LILPQYDAIKAINLELEARQLILTARQEALKKVEALSHQAEERQDDIDKLAILLPTNVQTDQVITSLDAIARQSGMRLTEIAAAPAGNTGQELSTLSITIPISGTYTSFLNFLNLIEQNLRLYDITGITIGPGQSQDSAILGFNVKINAYFIKQQAVEL